MGDGRWAAVMHEALFVGTARDRTPNCRDPPSPLLLDLARHAVTDTRQRCLHPRTR
jgi:hypothetical protein